MDALLSEWNPFKQLTIKCTETFHTMTSLRNCTTEACCRVPTSGSVAVPRTQPPTTVDAECGFSHQNLIKTDLRTNLDRLYMLLKIEGSRDTGMIGYDAAYDIWCNKDLHIFLPQYKNKPGAASKQASWLKYCTGELWGTCLFSDRLYSHCSSSIMMWKELWEFATYISLQPYKLN